MAIKKDISALLQEIREMESLVFVQRPSQYSDLVTSLCTLYKVHRNNALPENQKTYSLLM